MLTNALRNIVPPGTSAVPTAAWRHSSGAKPRRGWMLLAGGAALVAGLAFGDEEWTLPALQALAANYPRLQSVSTLGAAGVVAELADTGPAKLAQIDEQQLTIRALQARLTQSDHEIAALRAQVVLLSAQHSELQESVRQRTVALSVAQAELLAPRSTAPIVLADARSVTLVDAAPGAAIARAAFYTSFAPQISSTAGDQAKGAASAQIAVVGPVLSSTTGCAWVESNAAAPLVLEFDRYKDTLEPDHQSTLNAIVAAARSCSRTALEIVGHSDSRGSLKVKSDLAERRAELTAKFLEVHGVRTDQMSVIGMADRQPRESNATDTGRARNRRVEVRLQVPKQAPALALRP